MGGKGNASDLMKVCLCFLGVTGLVTTDHNNARDIDINLWAMTNQETGEYGVRSLS